MTADRTSPRPLFGWTLACRVALVAVAAGLGLALRVASWGSPAPDSRVDLPALVVDPNTAPAEVLLCLPRLGPALVGRIVAEREKAPFQSVEDLDRRVRGIGPATILALRPHLRVEAVKQAAP